MVPIRSVVVVNVVPLVRHEGAHVKIFRKGYKRRDLLVESVGMFETLDKKRKALFTNILRFFIKIKIPSNGN